MSRKWNKKDEIYVYNEKLRVLNNLLEPTINKIKSNLNREIDIPNPVNILSDNYKVLYNQYDKLDLIYTDIYKLIDLLDNLYSLRILYNSKFGDKLLESKLNNYNLIVNTILEEVN